MLSDGVIFSRAVFAGVWPEMVVTDEDGDEGDRASCREPQARLHDRRSRFGMIPQYLVQVGLGDARDLAIAQRLGRRRVAQQLRVYQDIAPMGSGGEEDARPSGHPVGQHKESVGLVDAVLWRVGHAPHAATQHL